VAEALHPPEGDVHVLVEVMLRHQHDVVLRRELLAVDVLRRELLAVDKKGDHREHADRQNDETLHFQRRERVFIPLFCAYPSCQLDLVSAPEDIFL
jgi:hypothetical protein